MSELRYELPKPENFLKAILPLLKNKGFTVLASLLSESKLSFNATTRYAYYMGGSIPNAYGTIVIFAVPPDHMKSREQRFPSHWKTLLRIQTQ
jgi:hypothetical protein